MLELLRSDPQRGLEAVVMQYSAYVMRIAEIKLGSVCSREDMEEAVSDIFLKFFNTGRDSGFVFPSVRSSLSLIAGRHCVDIYRRECRRQRDISLDEIIEFVPDADEDGQEISSELARAIHSLGEPDEGIIMRKYFFGQRTADIAKALKMRPNTVDKRISRALGRLRKILKEGEE